MHDLPCNIMVVEDELIIADLVSETLENAGYHVCGIARNVSEAVTLAQLHNPDLAVIDLKLEDGELGSEIAPQLAKIRTMAILYASGNAARILLTKSDGEAILAKPYRSEDLLRSVEIVDELFTTGKSSKPFPAGFQLLSK